MKKIIVTSLLTFVTGFDILHMTDKQSALVIHYNDRLEDTILIDNKYLKDKESVINVVEEILKQRNAY